MHSYSLKCQVRDGDRKQIKIFELICVHDMCRSATLNRVVAIRGLGQTNAVKNVTIQSQSRIIQAGNILAQKPRNEDFVIFSLWVHL